MAVHIARIEDHRSGGVVVFVWEVKFPDGTNARGWDNDESKAHAAAHAAAARTKAG